LQRQGFDYTYDKRLYDRLHARDASSVRGHLGADSEFQNKSVRFLENHDEQRAAAAFSWPVHQAAAIVTFLVPGLRFFHEGQLEGRRAKVSMHLGRRPQESEDPAIRAFYWRLCDCLKRPELREGKWQLLDCKPAWDANPTWWFYLAFDWVSETGQTLICVVNYGPTQGQCRVHLPFEHLASEKVLLNDFFGNASFERDGKDLAAKGLFIDLPAWGYNVFDCKLASQAQT
jgi:hypothetical protein